MFLEISIAEYRALPLPSYSSLRDLRESPEKFKALHIDKSIVKKQTDAMRLGSALDAMVTRSGDVRVRPKFDRRTTEGKRGHAQWMLESRKVPDAIWIDEDEQLILLEQHVAIAEHPLIGQFLRHPETRFQLPIRWTDDSGVDVKTLPDIIGKRVTQSGKTLSCIFDLKRTDKPITPASWARTCANSGYLIQAAMLVDGVMAATGETLPFAHIVVSSEAPYVCASYQFPDEAIVAGRLEYKMLLWNYKRRLETNDWRSDAAKQIVPLEFPEYLLRRA